MCDGGLSCSSVLFQDFKGEVLTSSPHYEAFGLSGNPKSLHCYGMVIAIRLILLALLYLRE